ncbi:30S ribosomal protein S1 [Clostridium sp.]|uniref:30S ribosomal protein S1 n=1 Tax=Clostridium sp. TaxID=1506 RepID=UPI0034649E3E
MTNEMSMEELLKDYDLKSLREGEIVKGKILSVTSKEVIVNINYMKDGIIPKSEYVYNEEEDLQEVAKVDDVIEVMILKMNDGEGNLILSKKKVDVINSWKSLRKAFKEEETLKVTPKEEVKGGLVFYVEDIRGFIPASQCFNERGKDIKTLIGNEIEVRLIEFDEKNKKVVASRRILLEEERKGKVEELWKSLNKGEKIKGKVTRLVNFGAFVDIGGLEGLVHLSDLSWKRVVKAEQVVSIGDQVEVYILDFDKEKNRISLALKDIINDPWNTAQEELKVNDVVEGTIVKFISVGAIVEVKDGIEGLVHLSEISEERVVKPSDVLTLNEKVKVKILDINKDNKRISLSIKDAVETPKEDYSEFLDEENGIALGDIFGDKLKDLFK